jgi:hypothetical protein
MIQVRWSKASMPEAVLDIVTDQTKDSPTGGKAN